MTRNLPAGSTTTRAGLVVSAADTVRGALPIGGGVRRRDASSPTERRALRRPAGYLIAVAAAGVVGAPQLVAAVEGWLR